VRDYSETEWRKLSAPAPGTALVTQRLQKFESVPVFFSRRLTYLDNFVNGCDEVLGGSSLSRKLICTRYPEGLPALDHDAIRQFRDAVDDYRRVCSGVLPVG